MNKNLNVLCLIIGFCSATAIYIILLTEWRPFGFAEKAQEINTIIVNLSYSLLAATIFHIVINWLPRLKRNKIIRNKINSYLTSIKNLTEQCVKDINLYDLNQNKHILQKEDFITQFSNKDLTSPCDYLKILERNNIEINLLIDFLLTIQEFLSNEEIQTLFKIKDSLFLTTKIDPKDYIQNEYRENIETPNNQKKIAESIYNIYELIKTIKK